MRGKEAYRLVQSKQSQSYCYFWMYIFTALSNINGSIMPISRLTLAWHGYPLVSEKWFRNHYLASYIIIEVILLYLRQYYVLVQWRAPVSHKRQSIRFSQRAFSMHNLWLSGICESDWTTGIRFPALAETFLGLRHWIQAGSGAQPNCYPADPGAKRPGRGMTTHLHPVLILRMLSYKSTIPYTFMVWCLINHSLSFTFYI
jgi:hypothetical protein